jgi:hypothetical protein
MKQVAIIVACMGEMRNPYKMLVIKLEGKIPLRENRWKDNIKMDLQEIRVGLNLSSTG